MSIRVGLFPRENQLAMKLCEVENVKVKRPNMKIR